MLNATCWKKCWTVYAGLKLEASYNSLDSSPPLKRGIRPGIEATRATLLKASLLRRLCSLSQVNKKKYGRNWRNKERKKERTKLPFIFLCSSNFTRISLFTCMTKNLPAWQRTEKGRPAKEATWKQFAHNRVTAYIKSITQVHKLFVESTREPCYDLQDLAVAAKERNNAL